MDSQKLRAIGWKPFFQEQLALEPQDEQDALDAQSSFFVARVSAHHGSEVLLLTEEGELCVPVRNAECAGEIAIGDWLVLNTQNDRATQRLERQTLLSRKASGEEVKPQAIAANLDTVFIVSSCNEDFNLSRIERYLALALQTGITPIVVLTKADLCDDPADLRNQAEQLHAGLVVETIDARQPEQANVLKSWCSPGQSVALLGSSGVGKTTLANALGAGDLATGGIREQDGKGRHTTTSRSLHLLPSGGILIDNPGIRELQLPECEEGLIDLFDDVVNMIAMCKFSDCRHEDEPGCAVTAAIESSELDERRYDNFQKLIAEQERNARSLAERRDRSRKTGKMYKAAVSNKRRRRDGM